MIYGLNPSIAWPELDLCGNSRFTEKSKGFQVVLVVKNPHNNAEDIRDVGSIPGLGRAPGEGSGYILRTPVLLPGESQGQRSLAGYSPWGRTESDMTKAT